jgi:N6-L-threonylcarbamoyladenine synthase
MSSVRAILGIETSCDDTAVALVDLTGNVLGSLYANQNTLHAPFGGVVPEMASRRHTEQLLPLLEDLFAQTKMNWSHVEAIAVTSRPGLIGSLLVGVVAAKALALAKGKKLIGINHIEGHLFAPFLHDQTYQPPQGFTFPYLGLAVSGGHSHLFLIEDVNKKTLLGKTRDDAAGEAFDKFAKLIGLGFPGGPRVDEAARTGDSKAFAFPRALIKEDNLDFSFSGLKTAAQRELAKMGVSDVMDRRADLCASFQQAIVDALLAKLNKAAEQHPEIKSVTITGGVSANSALRLQSEAWAKKTKRTLALPPLRFCTDNAAMIAIAGLMHLKNGEQSMQDLSPSAQSLPGDFL